MFSSIVAQNESINALWPLVKEEIFIFIMWQRGNPNNCVDRENVTDIMPHHHHPNTFLWQETLRLVLACVSLTVSVGFLLIFFFYLLHICMPQDTSLHLSIYLCCLPFTEVTVRQYFSIGGKGTLEYCKGYLTILYNKRGNFGIFSCFCV